VKSFLNASANRNPRFQQVADKSENLGVVSIKSKVSKNRESKPVPHDLTLVEFMEKFVRPDKRGDFGKVVETVYASKYECRENPERLAQYFESLKSDRNTCCYVWQKNFQAARELTFRDFNPTDRHVVVRFYRNVDDMRSALKNLDASGGVTSYAYKDKMMSKDEILSQPNFYQDWCNWVSRLLESGDLDDPEFKRISKVATRLQVSGFDEYSGEFIGDSENEGYAKQKTRIIHVDSINWVLLEGMFIFPFQKLFNDSDCYINGVDPDTLSRRVRKPIGRGLEFIEADASSFDLSITTSELTNICIPFYEKFLDFGNSLSLLRMWQLVARSWTHKFVITPDGTRLVKDTVFSGYPSTNLNDSLVEQTRGNLTCLHLQDIGMIREFICQSNGDDLLVWVRRLTNMQKVAMEFCSYYKYNCGPMQATKCGYQGKEDPDTRSATRDDPHILSRHFTCHGVWRHPNILIAKMMSPERDRTDEYAKKEVTPQNIFMAFYLMYPLGMQEMFDIPKFLSMSERMSSSVFTSHSALLKELPGSVQYSIKYCGAEFRL
jgi:hypothetical protein